MSDDADNLFGFQVARPGGVERPDYEPDGWMLFLPHQCGEWVIANSPNWHEAIDGARRFRAELDRAIAELDAAAP